MKAKRFAIKITAYDGMKKITLIKAIRDLELPELFGLKECLDFVNSIPVVIAPSITAAKSKRIVAALETAGATIALEAENKSQ